MSETIELSPVREHKKRHSGKYIYDCLREEILTLVLKPNTQLDEISLAERFSLSRSPVRDALARLAAEGLATTLPNRTTIVTPFNIEDFPAYIDALDLLQRAVTRLAAVRRNDEDVDAIRAADSRYIAAAQSRDYRMMFEYNKQFHLLIAKAGKNPYLTEHYAKLLEEGQRLLYLQFDHLVKTHVLSSKSANEHAAMIAAIAEGNPQAAEAAAHEHTVLFRDRFVEYMQQNLTGGIAAFWED